MLYVHDYHYYGGEDHDAGAPPLAASGARVDFFWATDPDGPHRVVKVEKGDGKGDGAFTGHRWAPCDAMMLPCFGNATRSSV